MHDATSSHLWQKDITSALQLLWIWALVHTDVKSENNAAFCVGDRNALA